MNAHRIVVVGILMLSLCCSLAAAEPSAAGTGHAAAAPELCLAPAGLFSAQAVSPGLPADFLAAFSTAARADVTCGCGSSVCLGKPVNSLCDGHLICTAISACSQGSSTRTCTCMSPP